MFQIMSLGNEDLTLFWTGFAAIATFLGTVATFAGAFFVVRQIRDTKKIAAGEFLLNLDEKFRVEEYQDLNNQLSIQNADWHPLKQLMNGDKVMHDGFNFDILFTYMGLFERIKILIDTGTLDIGVVNRLYGYRVHSIVKNNYLFCLLHDKPTTWQDFIRLCEQLVCLEDQEESTENQEFVERSKQLSRKRLNPSVKTPVECMDTISPS